MKICIIFLVIFTSFILADEIDFVLEYPMEHTHMEAIAVVRPRSRRAFRDSNTRVIRLTSRGRSSRDGGCPMPASPCPMAASPCSMPAMSPCGMGGADSRAPASPPPPPPPPPPAPIPPPIPMYIPVGGGGGGGCCGGSGGSPVVVTGSGSAPMVIMSPPAAAAPPPPPSPPPAALPPLPSVGGSPPPALDLPTLNGDLPSLDGNLPSLSGDGTLPTLDDLANAFGGGRNFRYLTITQRNAAQQSNTPRVVILRPTHIYQPSLRTRKLSPNVRYYTSKSNQPLVIFTR